MRNWFLSNFSFPEGCLNEFDIEKKEIESVAEVKKSFLMKIDNPIYNQYTKDILDKDSFEFLEDPDSSPYVMEYKVFWGKISLACIEEIDRWIWQNTVSP